MVGLRWFQFLNADGRSLRSVLVRRILFSFVVLAVVTILVFVVGFQWMDQFEAEKHADKLVSVSQRALVDEVDSIERSGRSIATMWSTGMVDPSGAEAVHAANVAKNNMFHLVGPRAVIFAKENGDALFVFKGGDGWGAAEVSSVGDGVSSFRSIAGNSGAMKKVRTIEFDVRTRPWFVNGSKARAACWTDVYRDYMGEMCLTYVIPVFRNGTERIGMLAVDLPVESLSSMLKLAVPSQGSRVMLSDCGGKLLGAASADAPATSLGGNVEGQKWIPEFYANGNLIRPRTGRAVFRTGKDGGRFLFLKEVYGAGGFKLNYLASIPRRDLAPTSWHGVVVPIVLLVLFVAITQWQVSRAAEDVVRPMIELAQEAASGDDSVPPRRSHSLIQEVQALEEAIFQGWKHRQEFKALQAQYAHMERLQVAGTLVGGVAHDLGNLLTIATSSQQLLATTENPESRARMMLATQDSLTKANALVHSLVGFCRGVVGEMKPMDLVAQVDHLAPLLSAILGKKGRLAVCHHDSMVLLSGNSVQLDQVIVNMVINARDAIGEGGQVVVQVGLNENGGARLVVSDDGVGIPEENVKRIFEPFFTTKALEGGSGLGLAMVRAIADDHSATVSVESGRGMGTVFNIDFPSTVCGLS